MKIIVALTETDKLMKEINLIDIEWVYDVDINIQDNQAHVISQTDIIKFTPNTWKTSPKKSAIVTFSPDQRSKFAPTFAPSEQFDLISANQ